MLIIFSTHPIQYQVPLWRKMTEAGIDLEVWYFTDFGINDSFDVQFGKSFSWDLPMLEGYKYLFLKTNNGAAPNQGFKNCRLVEDIKEKLIAANATHVYINGWQVFAYWQVLWTAKSLNLKVIFKGESNDLKPESKWKWPIKKILLQQFFKRIDHFLYIGEANKRLYIKYKISLQQLSPGLYCIDNDRFNREALKLKDQKNELRAKWGIPVNSFCILFSGKFIPKKRPLDIIKAVELLTRKHPTLAIHLLYVGDGELYDQIKSLTNVLYDKNTLSIDNNIRLNKINVSITGFLNQTEIPKAYAISDCLILPSNYAETWGLVVNEALACGIPAIVSNECGCAEDLANPISSNLVYSKGNLRALSESIKWVIDNPFPDIKIQNIIKRYNYNSTIESVIRILENY